MRKTELKIFLDHIISSGHNPNDFDIQNLEQETTITLVGSQLYFKLIFAVAGVPIEYYAPPFGEEHPTRTS